MRVQCLISHQACGKKLPKWRMSGMHLEDGCKEFSIIQGLGQIRFPKGNIKAAFEDIRAVLEREVILGPS